MRSRDPSAMNAARSRSGFTAGSGARNNGGNIGETNRRLMETENDEKASALASQISRLKELSIDINTEVEDQNRLLNEMGGQMGSTSGMLQDTIGKLNLMLQTGGSKHMCYLIVFVVFAFIVIAWIMKNKTQ